MVQRCAVLPQFVRPIFKALQHKILGLVPAKKQGKGGVEVLGF